MVFVFVPVVPHAPGKMRGKPLADRLHDPVAQVVRQKAKLPGKRVEAALDREHGRQPSRSEILDRQESILAVSLRDIEGDAVQVFTLDWRVREMREDVPPQPRQLGRIIRPDIEGRGIRLLWKRIEPNRKDHHLSRAARGLEQSLRVGVEAPRRIGIDVADIPHIVMVGGCPRGIMLDIGLGEGIAVQPVENGLRIVAKPDAKMVDKLYLARARRCARKAPVAYRPARDGSTRRRNCCRSPPNTDAPMQDEPMTECGSRPSGCSSRSS